MRERERMCVGKGEGEGVRLVLHSPYSNHANRMERTGR